MNNQNSKQLDSYVEIMLLDCRIFRDPSCWSAAFQRVPPTRQRKIRGYPSEEDRRLSLGAGLLAAHILYARGIDPARLVFAPDGRPTILGGGTFLSLSHAGDFAMAGLSSAPIGVDLERHQSEQMVIADHFFTSGERASLACAPDQTARFFQLWSRKECLIKRDGPADLRQISALTPPDGGAFYDFPLAGYSCVCCCTSAARPNFTILDRGDLF